MLIYVGFFEPIKIQYKGEYCTPITTDWHYKWESQMHSIPTVIPTKLPKHPVLEPLILTHNLPLAKKGNHLLLRTGHKELEVRVNGQTIYEYKVLNSPPLFTVPASAWHLISLEDYTSGELEIITSTPYKKYSGIVDSFYVGTKFGCLLMLCKLFGPKLFISILILIIGLLLITLYLFNIRKHQSSILYLGIFSILAGTWSTCETNMLQFIMCNNYIEYYLDYLCINVLPIPILLYLKHYYHSKKSQYYNLLVISFCLNFILTCILAILGLSNFKNGEWRFHILIIISILICLQTLIPQIFTKYKNFHYDLMGYIILCGTIFLDLTFYYSTFRSDCSSFFRIGMLLFIICLILDNKQTLYQAAFEKERLQMLETLAFKDQMTDLYNRTAFDQDINSLNSRLDTHSCISIIIFDINNLKIINDSLGHALGDQLIIIAATLIKKNFSNNARLYRIGGDEFVVMLTDTVDENLEAYLCSFCDSLSIHNQSTTPVLSIAYGYCHYDICRHTNLYDVFVEADAAMYQCKNNSKNSH